MSSAISQFPCFSSIIISRRLQFRTNRSYHCRIRFLPIKVLNVMNSDEHGTISQLESKAGPSYIEDASTSPNGSSIKGNFTVGDSSNEHRPEQVVTQPKRAAKIHDFCLGIPFGGLVLSGGLFGFIFSRNTVNLSTGVLFGGALLAFSTFSLKVWRQGNSSFPFILAQAVLSLALLSKNFKAYSLTKNIFPTGFNVVISAAMLCFYSYVVMSGGNPPPKKKPSDHVLVESS